MAATQAASVQRIEIVSDRRPAHDPPFRARVVAESYIPDIPVRELAVRHGICTRLVYRWRRECAPAAGTGQEDEILTPIVGRLVLLPLVIVG